MRAPDATAARKRATADRHGGIGSRVAPGSVRTVHRPGPIRGTPPGVGNGPTAIGAAPDRDHGGCRPGHAAGAGNEATVIGATPIGSELPTDGPPNWCQTGTRLDVDRGTPEGRDPQLH